MSKQLFYKQIYSLKFMKLKTLKSCIKTNSFNCFIQFFKFLTRTTILFMKKLDIGFNLYVNYQNSNKLIIRN